MNANAPIVVGVDGSESSLDAVRWAARDAVLRGAPLLLVSTMLTPTSFVVPVRVPATYFKDHEIEGKQRLAHATELAEAVAGRGLSIETELSTEPPVSVLLERSDTARMVVVGSRGLGEYTGELLGSVSSAVTAHARCPVAVIHGLPAAGAAALDGPVVVGVDGSKHSEPAIRVAFEEASMRGAELVAVHAWSDASLSTVFTIDEPEVNLNWSTIRATEEAVLSESLAGWCAEYPDLSVRKVVVQDKPARNLREQSETAQLVVVGSRGRGGFAKMILGSTSRTMVHYAKCPVMVVRERG